MQVLSEQSDELLKALVYGNTGTGKSTLGVTCPDPLILLSERQGDKAVRAAARRLGVPKPPTLFIEHLQDVRKVLQILRADQETPIASLYRALGADPGEMGYVRPKTIVCDSVTDYTRLVESEIDEQSPPKDGKDGLPVKSDRRWTVLFERCDAFIRAFRDLPYHVLFLALLDDRESGDDGEKVRSVNPMLPMRRLPGSLASAVNIVGVSERQVKLGTNGAESTIDFSVRFVGPAYMCTKVERPLRDVEVPDFGDWVNRLTGQRAIDTVALENQKHAEHRAAMIERLTRALAEHQSVETLDAWWSDVSKKVKPPALLAECANIVRDRRAELSGANQQQEEQSKAGG